MADYLRLGLLKRLFPAVPIMALTATATARVRADVQTMLGISGCPIFQVWGRSAVGMRDGLEVVICVCEAPEELRDF